MDFYQFFGFVVILKESIKLLSRNGKVMALVTILSLLSSSIYFLIFDVSSFSLTRDMLDKESLLPVSSSRASKTISNLKEIEYNLPRALTVFFAFVLSYLIISLLSMMATVIVSAESYNNKDLSLHELSIRIVKSWTRPFRTGFYTTIFVIGYPFFVSAMTNPLFICYRPSFVDDEVLYGVTTYVFDLYLSIFWTLSLVVSVVDEDCGGIAALGKSAEIIKGQKLNGFLLNVAFGVASLAVYLCLNMITDEKISGLLMVNGSCLVRILTFVTYTVLYFQGKEGYSQEIELQWCNVEHTKLGPLGITPLAGVS